LGKIEEWMSASAMVVWVYIIRPVSNKDVLRVSGICRATKVIPKGPVLPVKDKKS
jgi:hypothetical protein